MSLEEVPPLIPQNDQVVVDVRAIGVNPVDTYMSHKILVIDDEPEILKMTGEILKEQGMEVAMAANGKLALEEVKRQRPDLILVDFLMPEMDGYTFYKQLKNSPDSKSIPVVFITGRGKMEDSFRVVGAEGVLTKPFSVQQLISEVDRVLKMPPPPTPPPKS